MSSKIHGHKLVGMTILKRTISISRRREKGKKGKKKKRLIEGEGEVAVVQVMF